MDKESFEFKKITNPSPEEALAAQRAADVAAREKAAAWEKYRAETGKKKDSAYEQKKEQR